MAGRGRPKKKVEVPETVQELIQRVEPELIEAVQHINPVIEDNLIKTSNVSFATFFTFSLSSFVKSLFWTNKSKGVLNRVKNIYPV